MWDLAGGAIERVRATDATSGVRSPRAGEARAEDGAERRGAGRRDPDGAEDESVSWRGPPVGEGAGLAAKGIRLWGSDASRFWTKAEGWCWFFAAVDHCTSDVIGWHVAKKGDRWAALEPVRQGVRAHMGGFAKGITLGLGLQHDWGSQYRARQFHAETKWLGIRSTPAYVGEP